MTANEFIKRIEEESAGEFHLDFSKIFVLDKDEEIKAILDIPILAIAFNAESKEIRFMILEENVSALDLPIENLVENIGNPSKKPGENNKIH